MSILRGFLMHFEWTLANNSPRSPETLICCHLHKPISEWEYQIFILQCTTNKSNTSSVFADHDDVSFDTTKQKDVIVIWKLKHTTRTTLKQGTSPEQTSVKGLAFHCATTNSNHRWWCIKIMVSYQTWCFQFVSKNGHSMFEVQEINLADLHRPCKREPPWHLGGTSE
jgi:hypothetical protein